MAHTNPRRLDCLRLYKYMVTCSRLLPRQGSDYYLRYGRQEFKSYTDEVYPPYIDGLLQRGLERIHWVLHEYNVEPPLFEFVTEPSAMQDLNSALQSGGNIDFSKILVDR